MIDKRQDSGGYRPFILLFLLSFISGGLFIMLWRSSFSTTDDTDIHQQRRFTEWINVNSTNYDEKPTRRLPNAIIIGVKKGGTRALLEYLRMHPQVKAPGPEVHFFDRYFHLGRDWYRRQMPPTSSSQVAIEKTPSYFVTKDVPERIHAFEPNTKLIVVLRNPVTRALSDYAQNVAKRPGMSNFEDMAFLNATRIKHDCDSTNCTAPSSWSSADLNSMVNTSWGAIKIGLYHRYVRRWLKYFGMKRVHFVCGECLVTNPASETNEVEQFLGLNHWINDEYFVYPNSSKSGVRFPCLRWKRDGKPPRCLGKTKGRTHPKVDDRLLNILKEFYRPHNEELFELIGRRFDW